MTPVPLDVPLLFDALLGSAAGGLLGAGTSELAWEGERVTVVGGGATAPLLGRIIWPSSSPTVSMNATVGPATTAWVWRSCRLLGSGWLSGVIQIKTGPLIPWGTMQLLSGCEMVKGAPPVSIWQLKFCGWTIRKRENESGGAMRGTVLTVLSVLALRAGELNCNCVPVVTFPVLVMESGTLASNAVREKQKVQGSHQKFGPVSYGDTRTGDAEVTRACDECPSNGENLLGKHGYVKRLRD
jgi:hypothetical protein